MNDHTGVVASEYDITRGLFDAFSKSFVPDESRVYAVLTYIFPEEYRVVVEELRKSSLEFLTEKQAASKRGLLQRLQYWRLGSHTLYVRDAKRRDFSRWYRESESWTSTCFKFLRHITPRTSRTIQLRIGGKTHHVGVKIAEDRKGRVLGFKVEYEDLRRISDQTGISVLKLQRLAKPLLELLEKGDSS